MLSLKPRTLTRRTPGRGKPLKKEIALCYYGLVSLVSKLAVELAAKRVESFE